MALSELEYHITEPNFIKFLEKSIQSSKPIIIGAFKLKPGIPPKTELTDAIYKLVQHNVKVHVLLESRLTNEEKRGNQNSSPNIALEAFMKTGAILIKDLLPFKNLHLKVLLSNNFSIISTSNYDDLSLKYYKRDFNILITEEPLLIELRNILSLIEGKAFIKWPQYKVENIQINETRLSWGPTQHRDHFLELIAMAKKTIHIYQQDLQDILIWDALRKKLEKNIEIFILMSRYPFGKKNGNKSIPNLRALVEYGAQVRLTGKKIVRDGLPLHIHAKVLLIDGGTPQQAMYLGSANFYPAVLNPQGNNLNLGVITRVEKWICEVHKTFQKDWNSHN